jgi:ADP-heptose:LPS heptosyltransferase
MRFLDGFLGLFHRPSECTISASPQKILLCSQAHIGDAIIATSVLPIFAAAFPHAEIGFLINSVAIDVLADNPHVKHVHTFDHWRLNRNRIPLWQKFKTDIQTRFRTIRELRRMHYDLAIDLYPYFPNSITPLYAAGIPVRLGWNSGGMAALLTHVENWADKEAHIVEWYKCMLKKIDACEPYLPLAKTELYVSEAIRGQWRVIAKKHHIPENYIIFHIGSGGVHRRWQTENWRKLAKLCTESGFPVVLLGHGKDEQEICLNIAKDNGDTFDLSGQLTWRVMTECIGLSRLLVGLESAAGHIAAARNVTPICIYTGTTRTSCWMPYHTNAKVVVADVPCSPCFLPNGCEGMECIKFTAPETIFSEIRSRIL